jgi:acyl-CoA reductase-like NAD-dependent aldehyde dehydrogenase
MLTVRGQQYEFTVVQPSVHEHAMLEELSFVRREAQAEADTAYHSWLELPCRDAYAVYRAAQDRADAAQDDLAECVRRMTTGRSLS